MNNPMRIVRQTATTTYIFPLPRIMSAISGLASCAKAAALISIPQTRNKKRKTRNEYNLILLNILIY